MEKSAFGSENEQTSLWLQRPEDGDGHPEAAVDGALSDSYMEGTRTAPEEINR